MKPIRYIILAALMASSYAVSTQPVQQTDMKTQTYHLQACRNNCQESYNVCVLACPNGSIYYPSCESTCREKFSVCFYQCEDDFE